VFVGIVWFWMDSDPALPISRAPMLMCDGQDLNVSFSLTVDDREREALQNELAGSLQTLRPTVRRLRY